MPTRYKVAERSDFTDDGDRLIAEIDGLEIVIFRIDGEFHALVNHCPHQAGPLGEGDLTKQITVEDDGWTWEYDESTRSILCPWHGWVFDVTTGQNVDTDRFATPTFEVETENEEIFIIY